MKQFSIPYNGSRIYFDTAWELGELSVTYPMTNPFDPDCEDYDRYEQGRYYTLNRLMKLGGGGE